MDEVTDVSAVRARVNEARCRGETIGFVPTMGYLHRGHSVLMDRAREENEVVVVSIFVNPTQFGPSEDFADYPRDLERDRRVCREAGVDLLFLPSAGTMYPDGAEGQTVWVDPGRLAEHLCGAARPGHFRGVATVVAKLFAMVEPDRAYFGQKDAQQAVILTRMVRDLAFPVEVRVVPTVREPDGLALSSRNAYLSDEERPRAAALWGALGAAQSAITRGERDARRIEAIAREVLARAAPESRIDYISVADLDSLQPMDRIERSALIALAVYVGKARLIDNVIVRNADSLPRFS